MVLLLGKTLAVVDADMPELAHVQHVIAAQTVGVHQAIRLDFSLDHGQPGISLDVFNYQSVDLALTFEDAEDDDFAGSAASPFALSFASEITLVQFHRAVKDFVRLKGEMGGDDHPDFPVKQGSRVGIDAQQIGSGTSGHFQDEILKQFPLNIFAQFTSWYLHVSSLPQLLI